ncbi:hypothetical protein JL15_02910 [Mycolicibacterium phlei DSM 43071]|nr:hypothetical protein JL15_02910 [Mycolicibacterium phlei DSM 43071]
MVLSLRRFQAALAASRPPIALAAEISDRLEADAATLLAFSVAEHERPFGNLFDRTGRAQAMSPPFKYESFSRDSATGTVTFSDFYLGGNGAVHGGAVPLIFDEILGLLANTDRPRSRTAYLHVDYRQITPVNRPLRIDAWVDREEGRKLYLKGVLRDDQQLLAEAEGLFVTLRPGQP